jgi:peptidoglycan hydrolase-like protein with peptidoglycan-binding domain
MGHIAVCDGKGGTVEAKGRRYGVVADTVHGRGWHTGLLVPELHGDGSSAPIKVTPPAIVYELNAPNMDKAIVTRIQEALAAKGFDPGLIDGDFGLNTQNAVLAFQEAEGMVVDGAVGPETAAALGVSLLGELTGPVGPLPEPSPIDLQSLLPLILMLLSKEKPMGAKPGQGLELLLPLILQAALTGKQIDLTQLVTMLATGKPALPPQPSPPANTVPGPVVQSQLPQTPQMPGDLITLLLPVLYERITNKPFPGTEKADAPTNPNVPVLSKPSVQLSAGALGIVSLLQAFGQMGMPFNLGSLAGKESTFTGTVATMIPLIVGAVGATGGWGALAGIAAKLLGGIVGAFKKT